MRASTVVTGHSRSKNGVASARLRPGDLRLAFFEVDVDGRDKPCHDEESIRIANGCYDPVWGTVSEEWAV